MVSLGLYSLLYILFCLVLIFPPTEFVSAGVCVETVLGSYLGSEDLQFVQYHVRRTTANIIFHSLLPLGYFLFGGFYNPKFNFWEPWKLHPALHTAFYLSVAIVVVAILTAAHRSRNYWKAHPICKRLTVYSNGQQWFTVASDINIEFRRIDKFTSQRGYTRVVITDNWIMKITQYNVYMVNQDDAICFLESSDEIELSHVTTTAAQFLNIRVQCVRPALPEFSFRINSFDFRDIKDKLRRPLVPLRDITIQQSVVDQFVTAFKEIVKSNPKVAIKDEIENCIGCMRVTADVKLVKRCLDDQSEDLNDRCQVCNCRPMWCVDCVGKWFASRQDQNEPETWLSSRSPCPTCRRVFCMWDVCLVEN